MRRAKALLKEMVGGCCVCSDENGWTENPLVYCDGQGCTVAVHQACYGIVTVPTGAWFCRKCESQERAARVRCELCPSKDGALKRTDSGGWAHVVCALYIPEVRFGNVTTMEPIMLQLIPQERFNKSCYICEESGKESRATIGACMQCNKSGCKQHFHVTCAQSMGLLCEEAGNYLDNVKYCGYCQYHFSKLHGSLSPPLLCFRGSCGRKGTVVIPLSKWRVKIQDQGKRELDREFKKSGIHVG
ncbi:LOW QUALITY PROTEIN: protein AF-10-like [Macrobrachium nipponense]|uniref:LOW QUALITY PROTEIN: protein AF-10-like n=1 Tax=Macrobrachium nipponense TaxID=159736 RepID=UPI0030C80526